MTCGDVAICGTTSFVLRDQGRTIARDPQGTSFSLPPFGGTSKVEFVHRSTRYVFTQRFGQTRSGPTPVHGSARLAPRPFVLRLVDDVPFSAVADRVFDCTGSLFGVVQSLPDATAARFETEIPIDLAPTGDGFTGTLVLRPNDVPAVHRIFEGADLAAERQPQTYHVRIRVHPCGERTALALALASTPQDPPAFACP